MLERLLTEIREGGTLETSALAARLGTSPQLIAAMLDHLERLGLIGDFTHCSSACGGCSIHDACPALPNVRLWQHQSN